VADRIEIALDRLGSGLPMQIQQLEDKSVVERQVLVERHLVSHELATGEGPRLCRVLMNP